MALLKITRKGESHQTNQEISPLSKGQLGISDKAAQKITELLLKKPDERYFRVAIRGGGCSGFSIHFAWAQIPRDQDAIFVNGEAMVVIDKKSLSILSGATLDCRDYLGAPEFFLQNNPAAKQCSCGKSFAL